MAVKAANLPFEKALERLETIVEKLESGSVPLAEAVKMFEEGIELRKRCLTLLREAEQRIKFLRDSEGEVMEVDAPEDWDEADDD